MKRKILAFSMMFLVSIAFYYANSSAKNNTGTETSQNSYTEISYLDTQTDLNERRSQKLQQFVKQLQAKDTEGLASTLSDYKETTSTEAQIILTNMEGFWADFSTSKIIKIEGELSKGEMLFIAHERYTSTNFGEFEIFESSSPDAAYYLRIGLLFKKGTDKVGAYVMALIPR
ncbi:MAG: hypothetical protein GY696_35330 [Gammaproteobacteria bacterium]|nr:hypothetical protein [Gammaproteobacteria bacterium]